MQGNLYKGPSHATDADEVIGLLQCQAHMRVSGPGVTPFGPANQQRLINVFADVARNLSQSQFRIVLVSDAYTFRRHLMVSALPQSCTKCCNANRQLK